MLITEYIYLTQILKSLAVSNFPPIGLCDGVTIDGQSYIVTGIEWVVSSPKRYQLDGGYRQTQRVRLMPARVEVEPIVQSAE